MIPMERKKGPQKEKTKGDNSEILDASDDLEENPLASILPEWDLVPSQLVVKRVRKKQ